MFENIVMGLGYIMLAGVMAVLFFMIWHLVIRGICYGVMMNYFVIKHDLYNDDFKEKAFYRIRVAWSVMKSSLKDSLTTPTNAVTTRTIPAKGCTVILKMTPLWVSFYEKPLDEYYDE